MIKRFIITFFLSFGATLGMYLLHVVLPGYLSAFLAGQTVRSTAVSTLIVAPTPTPTPGLTPVTIIIPKLKIQTVVEAVGVTETGNMDVPKNAANVAWYAYGASPSEEGNAVIAGHYDTPTGKPAIFYNLRQLEAGDEVEIVSVNGVYSIFTVVEKSTIPYDVFPNEEVFKTRPGKNLNLITCGGIWDTAKKTYLDRIVVYTTLKEIISDHD